MTVEFSAFVAEKLRYYVYLLIDPRDGQVFYVGKGIGNRVFAHARDALGVGGKDSDKLDRIRAVHAVGLPVRYELLRFGLSEREAFEVECAAIQLLGLDDLANVVAGHHGDLRGRMGVDVAISLFDAPPAPQITDPVLLIKIPKLWTPIMAAEDLYEATRGWWRLGPRRDGAKYAFSVNKGVIREVYEIGSWRPRVEGDRDWQDDAPGKPRWGFEGKVAEHLGQYRNTSVKHLYRQGQASPTIYVNC